MRIFNERDHIGSKVWVYCIDHEKRIVPPTFGELNKRLGINIIRYDGKVLSKQIAYRANGASWVNRKLDMFTDKQECIDAFNEECRVIIDKYNQLIQQTNNL